MMCRLIFCFAVGRSPGRPLAAVRRRCNLREEKTDRRVPEATPPVRVGKKMNLESQNRRPAHNLPVMSLLEARLLRIRHRSVSHDLTVSAHSTDHIRSGRFRVPAPRPRPGKGKKVRFPHSF